VQAVSGYRNESLNSCSNGAPASAHRMFFALDLMPVDEDVSRGELVSKVCAAHARDGRAFKTGLGFYNGRSLPRRPRTVFASGARTVRARPAPASPAPDRPPKPLLSATKSRNCGAESKLIEPRPGLVATAYAHLF
jgi:hypothetical protein